MIHRSPFTVHCSGRQRASRSVHGFTLMELVVVVAILGALAVIALPRFIGMNTDARIAAVKAGMGAVAAAQTTANMKCHLTSGCDESVYGANVSGPAGQTLLYYGFPNGQAGGINVWVQMDGFTPVYGVVYGYAWHTDFQLTGAPDPTMCKVTYTEHGPLVTTFLSITTSGC